MDGVGKSTTCQLLAKRLNYEFVEKPLHFLFDQNRDSFETYIRIRDQVNKNENHNFTAWFYGLGSIYMYELYKNSNIVTDRHLASNYAWSGTNQNGDIYDLLVRKIGSPKLTIILYANTKEIIKRLQHRNKTDSDIKKAKKSEEIYSKMICFCHKYKMPFLVIDTSKLSPIQVVDKIVEVLPND